MIPRYVVRIWLLLLSSQLVLPLYAAPEPAISGQATSSIKTEETGKSPTPAIPLQVQPGPNDGQIAYWTARMLESRHYLRQRFDGTVSSKFLDRYIDALDPQHLHFLQSDLAEFETYRTNLDRMTKAGDVQPACEIFNRYLQRLGQRVAYVDDLLTHEKFTFDTDEKVVVNRHEVPYPKNLDEAKKLWNQRVRFEYLIEKMAKMDAKKKAHPAAATPSTDQKNSDADAVKDKDADKDKDVAKDKDAVKDKDQAPPKTEAEEIVDTLRHRYHRTLHMFAEWNHDDVLQIYLTTLAHVYDPHSDYFGHNELDTFAIGMNLSLCGIGAELVSEDGYCTIRRLLPGGPAVKGGKIHEKDRIVAVAQSNQPPVDVVDMQLSKAVQLIRGQKGTEVRLTMIPYGSSSSTREVVAMVRDEIPLEEQAAKSKIIEIPNGTDHPLRMGVIDLPSFYAPFDISGSRRIELASARDSGTTKSTSADVERLLKKFKEENVSGVILDLRRNGGGSLDEAIKLTGLFIKQGPVVQVKEMDGSVQSEDDTNPAEAYDGPLIVLTSRFSASASEIVAGALQDYGRALIVGDSSTHGKGTVQSVNPVHGRFSEGSEDPGALKLTIKKFYRASGASTQLKGVVPDIVLPSYWNESKEVGESSLENPLAWDTIKSAKYDHMNLVEPYLQELRKRSGDRVAVDPEFGYVREDIEQYKKAQADKTVSLNEQTRLKERAENEARQKARDKERLARKEPDEKVYELSLRQASVPGLPAPMQKTNSLTAKVESKDVVPGVSTNSATASVEASSLKDQGTGADEDDDQKAPLVDETLVEAEHILQDYVSLWPNPNIALIHHPE
jgi:carboxyl-terminal processing protease